MDFFSSFLPALFGNMVSSEQSETIVCANEFLKSLENIKHIALEKDTGVKGAFDNTVSKTTALKESVKKGHFSLLNYYIDNVAASSDYFFYIIHDATNNPAIIHSQNCRNNLIAAAKSVRPVLVAK